MSSAIRDRAGRRAEEKHAMSASEIADNKWEIEATKAPIGSVAGLSQILLFVGFVVLFGYICGMSIVAIVTPKKESSLGEMYKNMKQDGTGPAAPGAAPATPEKPAQ
jgi:hypothetical protein